MSKRFSLKQTLDNLPIGLAISCWVEPLKLNGRQVYGSSVGADAAFSTISPVSAIHQALNAFESRKAFDEK